MVSKKDGKYRFIILAVSVNCHNIEDEGILPNIKEFLEVFAGLPICSLIDLHSSYDQKVLHEDSQDYMAFQTIQGIYRLTRLVQGATNSVSAFVWVSRKILSKDLGTIAEVFIDDIGVKGPKTQHGDEEAPGLPGVWKYVLEHLQNLDKVLADIEWAGATVLGEKSDWCWNGIMIVDFVCREAGRWPQASKADKVQNWLLCRNCTECRAFLGLCTYYCI